MSYSPGYAPIGEVRDMRGRGGEEGGAGTGQWAAPPHRYGRKRPLSDIAKLIHMRKCKRYTFLSLAASQHTDLGEQMLLTE